MTNVKTMVEQVLRQEAPDELFLLPAYDGASAPAKATSSGPMGIGVEHIAALLLPLLWTFFNNVLTELSKDTARETVKLLKKILSNAGTSGRAAPDGVSTPADLLTLRNLVQDDLRRSGIDLAQHPGLPDTVVQTLMSLKNPGVAQ